VAGCCSVATINDFKVIVIGDTPVGISIALHAISYGVLTALIHNGSAENQLQRFFEEFRERAEDEQGMVRSFEELNEDMDLILLEGQACFEDRHTLMLNQNEIRGKQIVIAEPHESFKPLGIHQIGLRMYKKSIPVDETYRSKIKNIWAVKPSDAWTQKDEIWRIGAMIGRSVTLV
jgi:pyruvate/2-oxoglutarate dehydrogenase complex dihydrolipoamide dehydrogenase (E3) component